MSKLLSIVGRSIPKKPTHISDNGQINVLKYIEIYIESTDIFYAKL